MPERTMEAKELKRRETLTAFVKAEAHALGFDLCRITRPDSIPDAKDRLGEFIDAEPAWDDGVDGRDARAARRSRTLWSDVQSVVVFALNYGPDEDPRGILDKPDKAPSPSMRATATITTSSRAAEGDRDAVCGARRRRRQGLRRYGAGDGKAAGGGGRARLAGQAHQPRQPRAFGSWLFLGSMFTTADLSIDTPESITAVRAAPVSTPARPTPSRRPTRSMRGAASPI
jgi:epoxyqueuosine reductase